MENNKDTQSFNRGLSKDTFSSISDVNDNKMIIELEKKIKRLINELNEIVKEAENGGDYKYLSNKYIWKSRVLKQTENRLINFN